MPGKIKTMTKNLNKAQRAHVCRCLQSYDDMAIKIVSGVWILQKREHIWTHRTASAKAPITLSLINVLYSSYIWQGVQKEGLSTVLNSSYKETFSKWVMLQGLSNTALLSWLLPVAFFRVYTAKECEVLQRQDMWASKKASTLVFHLHLQLQRFGWWISSPPQHGKEAKRKAVMEQLGAFTLILHNYTGSFDDLFNLIKKVFILQAFVPGSNPRVMNLYLLFK